tara:strand:- start:1377 stop:1754 length:378 start_codon:yes stop_codon:yes gene_type:complete
MKNKIDFVNQVFNLKIKMDNQTHLSVNDKEIVINTLSTYVCEECFAGWWDDPGSTCPLCKTSYSITKDFDRRCIECPNSDAPCGSEFWLPYHWESYWSQIEEHCDYIADQADTAYERRIDKLGQI